VQRVRSRSVHAGSISYINSNVHVAHDLGGVLHDAMAPCVWLHVCITLGVQKRDGYGVQVLLELVCTYFPHQYELVYTCHIWHVRVRTRVTYAMHGRGDCMVTACLRVLCWWAGPFARPLKKTPCPHVRMD
jgi:hypothetical protein